MFDIFYLGSSNKLKEQFPFAKQYSSDGIRCRTKMYWLVDSDTHIKDYGIFNFRPEPSDQGFVHIWQGGLQLIPRAESVGTKKHHDLVAERMIEILYQSTPGDYFDYNPDRKYVWCLDPDYVVTEHIGWSPDVVEPDYIHNFHLQGQLTHKYTEKEGGVNLFPRDWVGKDVKYHGVIKETMVSDPVYPVYYVEEPDKQNPDHACWMIDQDYILDDNITEIPWQVDIERQMIHVYHVAGQLKRKYPEEKGGVYWYPGTQNSETEIYIHDAEIQPSEETLMAAYPVYYVEEPDKQKPDHACWMIDQDYILSDITEIPWQVDIEKQMIHVYHVVGQLEHKYPQSMGGVYWYPGNGSTEYYIHDECVETKLQANLFPVYHDEEIGRAETNRDWFWVVDPNVTLLDDFELSYVPEVWDQGKKHVWQVVNPISGMHYDYAGVALCPKDQSHRRSKYIKQHACIQKEFPVYRLDAYSDPVAQLEAFDSQTDNSMYWVIDPFVEVVDDFAFDVYPTQWDSMNVHVFTRDPDGENTGLRLFPKGTFVAGKHDMLIDDVYANRFVNLKVMPTVATQTKSWPVERFQDQTLNELTAILQKHTDSEFVFTVDPDVEICFEFQDQKYIPDASFVDRIHLWQRINPHTKKVHSYGGLRLWPTNTSLEELTTSDIQNNKFRNRRYVRETGAVYHEYNVVFISYHEPYAAERFESLKEIVSQDKLHWVRDVEGIFNAHKHAAELCDSKMFWVVDADAEIAEGFDFSYIPNAYDQEVVHVWHSRNPITGDVYGYGGVKLFNREQVMNATSWGLDFTTGLSTRFKVVPELSCTTRFNTDPFNTWRSAFRESVKLSLKDDAESQERLMAWKQPLDIANYREECISGVNMGIDFAKQNKNDSRTLSKINDYEFLQEMFNSVRN